MDPDLLHSAARVRSLLERGVSDPGAFRAELERVPVLERDAWVDEVLGLYGPPADDPSLPQGCVPYLPCPVDALLRVVQHAPVSAGDVFVDIGSGAGRALALVHLLTGARTCGVEIQPPLVASSRVLVTRLGLPRNSIIERDAVQATAHLAAGTVFFLYCPFSGERLARLLGGLGAIARTHPVTVCCVDLPLPACEWLQPAPTVWDDLAIYRSTPVAGECRPLAVRGNALGTER